MIKLDRRLILNFDWTLLILVLVPYIFPKPADAELGRWFPKGGLAVQVLIILLTLILTGLTIWAVFPTP